MPMALATMWPDAFETAAPFAVVERRLAGTALDAWAAGGGAPVAGFERNTLLIADLYGAPHVIEAGNDVVATFGLAVGMTLEGRAGLAAEILASVHLIAIVPEPVPFEACLASPTDSQVMARGVALPVTVGGDEMVQIVLSWREVLDRAATKRLRRQLTSALRLVRSGDQIDPFAPRNAT